MSTDWNTFDHEDEDTDCAEGCPFCRITELEAEVERLRGAVGMITYYGLDDCWKAAKDMRAIAKAALEGKDG